MKHIHLYLLLFILTSCSQDLYSRLSRDDKWNTHYKGRYKIGKTYERKGVSYIPQKDLHYNKIGMASWYGKRHGFHGKKTANGDKYDKSLLTAAHPTLPMPSLVKVTNLKNNKSLILMINDRGPFSKNRIIDVSEKAADILGFKHHGVTKVRVQYLDSETDRLLSKLSIKKTEGGKAKSKIRDPRCSVNCYIKLVNIENGHHKF